MAIIAGDNYLKRVERKWLKLCIVSCGLKNVEGNSMRRRAVFAVITAIMGVLFAVHYYIWLRLVHDTALPEPYAALATVALLLLLLSQPLSMVAVRAAPKLGRLLAWPAFLWMGTILLLLVTLASADVLKLVLALGGADPDSAALLDRARWLEGAAAILAASLTAIAILRARALMVRAVEVTLDHLPHELDGLVIVQLTDIHVGPTIGRRFMDGMVAQVNGLNPDIVCITGDLADGPVHELRHAIEPLSHIKAKHGVFFVTGNHEYYNNVDEWLAAVTALGVRVLRNERVTIAPGLYLAGVDDLQGRMRAGHGPDLEKALGGVEANAATVLMAHQPKMWPLAVKARVGLMLAGHTHAGQIWPFHYLVKLDQTIVSGLVRDGVSQLYVSAGTGYWGPPMRLGSTAEISRVTLRSKN